MKIDGTTTICASIGNPNKHTASPVMHNAGFEYLGLNYVYLAFEPRDLGMAIDGMRSLGIRGFSVSKPFKQDVMRYLDQIDPIAGSIGAVNTILNDGTVLKGFNSDWIGAIRALEEKTGLKGKRAVVLGAGGVARAIVYGLRQKGCNVLILNRTPEKAKKLATEFGAEAGALGRLKPNYEYDILINATNVGQFPNTDDTILPGLSLLRSGCVVLDVVSNPLETRLVREAKQKNCVAIPGHRMLLHQGVFQFELFTGVSPAPIEAMGRGLIAALSGA